MINFKKFLVIREELNLKEKQQVKTWKRDPNALIHTDDYFGKGNDEVNTQLEGSMDKSEVHKRIERHLGQEIPIDHYKSGKTKDKYNRDVKIGALLNKNKAPQDLINAYANDNTKQGKKFTGLSVRTTRSPEGVAGQTSRNQSWENGSCKNFNTGSNRHYLKDEVEHGTVVSYLHDHTGKEIARATLQPHINDDGHRVYAVDSHYGIDHAGFKDHVEKVAEHLSGQHKGGSLVYTKHPDVYSDNGKETLIHPNVDAKTLNDRYEHLRRYTADDSDYEKYKEKSMLLQHPKIYQEHLDRIINSPSSLYDHINDISKNPNLTDTHISKILHSNLAIHDKRKVVGHNNISSTDINKIVYSPDGSHFHDLKETLATHKKLTPEHISKLLDNDSSYIRESAMANPNADADDIHKGLDDDNEFVRGVAMLHHNVNSDHIERVLKDKDRKNVQARHNVFYNKNIIHLIKPEHIDEGLKDNDKGVRLAAATHRKASDKHIHKALDNEHMDNYDKADIFKYGKGNITPEHIDKALDYKSGMVREAALEHPNASPDNLIKGINHLDAVTQMVALQHKNVNDKVINHALSHEDNYVRMNILKNPNIKPHHIDAAMNDVDQQVRKTATDIKNKSNIT
jgi:hypothetical protein